MVTKQIASSCLALLIVLTALPLLSCGSSPVEPTGPSGVDIGEIVQLVSDIARADSVDDRAEAINAVVKQGLSLGLFDENGNQLNENVAADAVSLTPEDVSAFAAFVDDGRYQTVGNVVDYLSELGVVLVDTSEIITTGDLLPDLQQYVNWSFAHPDDPESQLGILLASGPGMEPPTSTPQMTAETQISPLASVLMLGDILIGKPDEDITAMNPFVKKACAADIQKTAVRIMGLITKIESTLSSEAGQFLAGLATDLGKRLNLVKKDANLKIEVPALAKKIISAFAFGNYFQVRMRTVTDTSISSLWPVDKSLLLDAIDPGYLINPVLVLAPASANEGDHYEIMQEVPVVFTARLLSANEDGTGKDLFPDANAVLAPGNAICKTAANGHRLDTVASSDFAASFYVRATRLDNTVERHAVLHTSASILTGDLAEQFEKYKEPYGTVIKNLGLKPEELAEMFTLLSSAVKVAPTMSQVILFKGGKAVISPESFSGKPGDSCTFTVKKENLPAKPFWTWELEKKPGGIIFDPDLDKVNSPTASISFPDVGEYVISVILWEGDPNTSGRKIDWAEATATITGGPMDIEITGPDITGPGQPLVQGKEYKFIARTGAVPEDPVYVWYFPDGTQEMPFTNEITWAFPDTGNWLVAVDLFNTDTSTKPIQSASIEVKVVASETPETDVLKHLQEMTYFDIDFSIAGTLSGGNNRGYGFGLDDYGAQVSWDGVNFSVSWSYSGRSGTATGQVSPDGTKILRMTLLYEFETDEGPGWYRLEITGLPLWEDNYNDMFNQRVDDEDVQQYVSSFTTHESFTADWSGDVLLNIYFGKTPF